MSGADYRHTTPQSGKPFAVGYVNVRADLQSTHAICSCLQCQSSAV